MAPDLSEVHQSRPNLCSAFGLSGWRPRRRGSQQGLSTWQTPHLMLILIAMVKITSQKYLSAARFDRYAALRERLRKLIAVFLACLSSLSRSAQEAVEPSLDRGAVRRALVFALGSLLILGVLLLSPLQSSTFSPMHGVVLSVLMLVTVTVMLILDFVD